MKLFSYLRWLIIVGAMLIGSASSQILSKPPFAPLTSTPQIFYEDFSRYLDNAVISGVSPLVGSPWITTGASIPTTSGGYAQSAGTGYLYAYLPSIPFSIAADFSLVGGSASTGAMTISYADNPMLLQNLLHLNISANGYILSRYNAGVATQIVSGNWDTPMALGSFYRVQMALGVSLVTITGPNGETITASNSGVAANVGQSAFWEPNLSSGTQAKLLRAYAIGPGSYFGPGDLASNWGAFYSMRAISKATLGNHLIQACTASDASCVDLNSDSSTGDLNISGITCDNGSNLCTIKKFYELSGNFASGDMVQNTIANRATLVVPGAANGCPNATRACAKFVGTSQCYLTVGTLSLTRPTGYTAVSVQSGNAGTGSNGAVMTDKTGTSYGQYYNNNTNARLYWGGVQTAISAAVATWNSGQAAITSNSVSSTFNLNGTPATWSGGNTNLNDIIGIGSEGCTGSFLNGYMTETGYYNGDFSSFLSQQINNQRGYWRF